jgi:glycosyltransferase involved in cell wall biosynthesis
VGRVPEGNLFQNVRTLGVLNGEELKVEYSKADIFLALMLNDACSNALIEAQAMGLLIVYFDSGGNAEIIHKRSIKVNNNEEILRVLIEISRTYRGFNKLPYQRVSNEEYISSLCSFWE